MNKDLLANIENVMKEAISAGNIPGASALVIRNGEEKYYCEAGYANIGAGVPIKRDTIFRLYSMTKPVTGAAAMILMQRGMIDLHDPVSKYIPGFKNQMVHTENGLVPAEREVTIKHLLNMTSGLPYERPNFAAGQEVGAVFSELGERLCGNTPMTTMELANRIGQCGLMFQPGSSWRYGTSADVTGAVVEAVTGKKYGQFLHDEIFAPLGMDDTDFYVPSEKQSRLARTYTETPDGMVETKGNALGIQDRMEKPPAFESGGAGLASTIDDYAKFASMLLNGGIYGGKRILSPKAVKFFTEPQYEPMHMDGLEEHWGGSLGGFSYGNFMRVMVEPGKAVFMASEGEYGWDGALGVYFLNSPEDDLTFIFMTQRSGSGTLPVTRKLRNIVFSALQ